MRQSLIIQETLDGSHTLYIPDLDEHYHSVNGAIQEARHVYIEAAFNQCIKQEIHVLEMGFGTGLNTLLTILEARKRGVKLIYSSLEKYPLSPEIYSKLNYSSLDKELFQRLQNAEWNCPVELSDNIIIHKIKTDFLLYNYPGGYDVVYYDAFAPDKQNEVWSRDLFNKLYLSMNPKGILSTYCAKGEIRRKMKESGFIVNRIQGPPGKREMLQAIK